MNSKKVLFIILTTLSFFQKSFAQNFGNEWINYTQTYYKFGIFRDDIYRIDIAQLTALGMPSSVIGANLQLFRDGVEIPIYVSNDATLGATDYIEFYGEKANGTVDIPLYKNPTSQLNPNQNLLSDTAYYFVTFNAGTTNKRFTPLNNNVSAPPIKEAFFWDKSKANYRGEFIAGTSHYYQSTPVLYLSSSQYEEGEGYSKKLTTANDSITYTCLFPYKVAGGPNAYFKTTVAGYSYISWHQMKIFANNNLIGDSTYSAFGFKRFNASVPMAWLNTSNKMIFKYTPINNSGGSSSDRYGISYTEFRYPREFNFNNVDSFYFELDPKLSDYYLEISNFKNGGVAPRLYDLSTNQYLIGDISATGIVKYLIPYTGQLKRLFIQSQAATSSVGLVSNLQTVQFKNYSLGANQGDYIILSHSRLFDNGTGINYVNEYKNYRTSISGGSYNPIVVDVNDVYNEFGYGYTCHPQSVKNFLRFAHTNSAWSAKPKYVFIIGKGIDYKDYLTYSNAPASNYPFPIVPSFGEPCSDALLTDFGFTSKSQIPIGRLAVWNGNDIGVYLEKIKDHEAARSNTTNQISDSVLWKKNVLHIAGAKKVEEQTPILGSLQVHENIIIDSFFGGKVTTIKKSSTSSVESANSALVDNLFNNGLGLVQFFGHASSSTLDYNLDNPELMKNYRRYPVFIANGCGVGNVFILASAIKTLGEKFVLSPTGGSIAFIACDNTGLSDKLGTYTNALYNQISTLSYGGSLGEQMMKGIATLNLTNDALLRQHAEQIILNGDPATSLHGYQLPDYAVEDKTTTFNPLNLTTSIDSFDLNLVVYNLGKYTRDSISLFVKRTLPNGIENIILQKKYAGIGTTDTLKLRIPVEGNLGIGDNLLDIILDEEGFINEVSETNNSIRRVFSIYNDDLVPVYPYKFGIVGVQGVTLKGSTLNPFAPERTYKMQIDTTEHFNSPLLNTTTISSKGGVIKWQPPITLKDSTVYYWRTAADTSKDNPKFKWSTSSFIYLDGSLSGWNQSHYFQYQKNNFADIALDTLTRNFDFIGLNKVLQVQNVCLYSPAPFTYDWPAYRVKMNGAKWYDYGCDQAPSFGNLQFIVIDTLTGEPWRNAIVGTKGRFGSFAPCRNTDKKDDPFFEFSFKSVAGRKAMMDFIDSIPQGMYVMIQPRLCTGSYCGVPNKVFINHWKADTTLYGSNNSLYHKIYNLGFTAIDSFYKNRPMIFFTKKNIPTSVQQYVETDSTKILFKEFPFTTYLYEGQIATEKIGPSRNWNMFTRRGTTKDIGIGDSVSVEVYGVDVNNASTYITTVSGDTNLSFIDAKLFPYLRLVMKNRDNTFSTPEQIKHWRILYQLVPEAALNPNRHFVFTDSAQQGQITHVEVAIENLTELPLDSMLVKYEMIDNNKNRKAIATKRYFPIPVYDTIIADIDINSSQFPGTNVFAIEANPDNDQLEQYHPNNIGFINHYVAPDKQNPLVDVTFDGVHILDKDIVSSKPFINITLRDENKYLALDDTSLVGVYMRYPGESPTSETLIPYDGNILKFIPADLKDGKSKNIARIEYRPTFLIDGKDYILSVKAKDKSGNFSGTSSYKVGFEIVNRPAISTLINYPNPFTTSTQFLFTITGSEVPSNLKIQIISPSGKVVREIVKSELGPLHIGTNLTEYRWKGDDQYGQPLANGVYLYRVISNLNGEKMDHYKLSETQNADKWMEKGFGKLYIMR